MTIHLLIADDHVLVCAALIEYLGMSPDIEVVGEAANGNELLEKLHTIFADMLLLDLIMPGLCGTELISRVRSSYPSLRILVLSMHNETRVVLRALRAGASATSARTARHRPGWRLFVKSAQQANTSARQWPSRSRFYPVQ